MKKYIEQKRTDKLKEKLEQRSPFIPYVPVGRWIERKEPLKKPKAFTISTPTKKALMSDGKILKKSTIKEIARTAMKENATAVKKLKKEEPIKSRKKILLEFNNVPQNEEKLTVPVESLDDTFEIIPDQQEDLLDKIRSPGKSPSPLPENVLSEEKSELAGSDKTVKEFEAIFAAITTTPIKKASPIMKKKNEIPAKINKENQLNEKKKEVKKPTAKIVVPVKRPTRHKTSKSVESKQVTVTKKAVKSKSVQEQVAKSPISHVNAQEEVEVVVVKSDSKKAPSSTYKFYKSSRDNQYSYISIQLNSYTSNLDSFINKLSEDMQNTVHQTIQHGNLLRNEKLKAFGDFLEKFEYSSEPHNITEDDIDNYWMILFDEIEDFKTNFVTIMEAKLMVTQEVNKRRTRKTILPDTPTRRSRRIAETVETPRYGL